MSDSLLAPVKAWLTEPLEPAVGAVVDRLRRAEDVRRIAIMPDVHLAGDELQGDDDGRLWLMIHSGSRAMGQAVRGCHVAGATPVRGGLRALDAETEAGRAYLHDMAWARQYADANRRAMADSIVELLERLFGLRALDDSLIACDHNHVVREEHGGAGLWVHRKGAMPAGSGAAGVLPGSMGTASFHVSGRGCAEAMDSSAHGAGRKLSREAARKRISARDVFRQMEGVWFDPRLAASLRDEAPGAYKDVRAVLRAEHELVRVVRTLRPLVAYKGAR